MNKIPPLTLCLFLLLFATVTKSQDKIKVDSLENLLKLQHDDDSTKVDLLTEIAFELRGADNNKAMKYSKLAIDLAEKLNYKKGLAKSYAAFGWASQTDNVNLAIENLTKGLKIAESINSNSDIASISSMLGTLYLGKDKNEALRLQLHAISLAEKTNDKKDIAKFMTRLGLYYMRISVYDKSISTFQKALEMAEKNGDEPSASKCIQMLGLVYNFQGNYPLSLEYYLKYLLQVENSNNRLNLFLALSDIGVLYSNIRDYSKSENYHKRALKIALELKDKKKLFMCYNNIGNNYGKTNDPREIEYKEKAFKIAKELNDSTFMAFSSRNLAPLYVRQGKIDLGLLHYKRALKISNNKLATSGVLLEIGNAYFIQKQYADALKYTLKALDLADKMLILNLKVDIHKQLSEIYAATNDSSKAYLHQKLFSQINDSVRNDKNTKRIAELEYNYKLEKEKHTLELKQQKKDTEQAAIMISLLIIILFLSLFAVYIYRSLREKRQSNLLLTEQNAKIEKLNAEYLLLNKEYIVLNEQLKLSNERINKELELNQKSMTAATLKLIQNAERDALTIQRLQKIEMHTVNDGKQEINSLVSDYRRSSYNSNWEQFEILFEKVHGSFYEKINSSYPILTTNERKMCAFLKLNMSNKDIANITFQSEEALKKARLRLRQKLQIERETNLTSFMQAI